MRLQGLQQKLQTPAPFQATKECLKKTYDKHRFLIQVVAAAVFAGIIFNIMKMFETTNSFTKQDRSILLGKIDELAKDCNLTRALKEALPDTDTSIQTGVCWSG